MLLDHCDDPPASVRGGVVSIGNFDGLHRGHHRLLASLRQRARRRGVPAVVVSFEPHPLALLKPQDAPVPLLWPARKVDLLRAAGADAVVLYRTTRELLSLSAEEFFENIVLGRLQARGVVEGPNFGFGRGRTGDVELLAKLCAARGLDFEVVELIGGTGRAVSSTTVRELLGQGEVHSARELTGRPHRIRGTVVVGRQRGRELGFPTANLAEIGVLVPAEGVYAVRVRLDGSPLPGACNVGPNPTFGDQDRKVEVHLLDFSGDLYGQSLELDFLERLRDVRAFDDAGQLRDQLARDIARVREVLAAEPEPADPERAELAATIREWVRGEFEPGLVALQGRLAGAVLGESGCLQLKWKLPHAMPPTETLEMLLRLEDRLRGVFPEVHSVESSTTD